jgi:hypothetical protein
MKIPAVIKIMTVVLVGMGYCGTCAAGQKEAVMKITVISPAFEAMAGIPSNYTCDGADVSPPLSWRNIPAETQSIVLICDDPDAPGKTWVHWVCYDIPPTADGLSANIPAADTLPAGGTQGLNSWGRPGYGGPCPPGGTHRYFFKVYALDILLNLPAGKTKEEIERAMQGHVLAFGELVGVYSRR